MTDTDKYSGIIGDKEVEMHRLSEFEWAIDVAEHTSEDTKKFVEGWVVEDEYEALKLFDEKVNELEEMIE